MRRIHLMPLALIAAPVDWIKSPWLNGGYNTISGTSMAAPHSAGAAILVLQGNQSLTPTQVEQQIVDDLDNWTTNDTPNADGRLDARCLGTGETSCAGNN
jgi:subtilisin family serine protease